MSTIHQGKLNSYVGDGARQCKYKVMFNFPSSVISKLQSISPQSTSKIIGEGADYICESISLPDVKVQTLDINLIGGKVFNIPVGFDFEKTITITFTLDEAHSMRVALLEWIRTFDYMDFDGSNIGGQAWLNGDGFGSIDIIQYDFTLTNATIKYTLHNVFPSNLGNLDYRTEAVGTILKITPTFQFSHYTKEIIETGNKIGPIEAKLTEIANNVINMVKDFGNEMFKKVSDSISEKTVKFFNKVKSKFSSKDTDKKTSETSVEDLNDFIDNANKESLKDNKPKK